MSTGIEWTDETWNPIRARREVNGEALLGWHCEHASPGCEHCYSETRNLSGRCNLGTKLPFKPGHRKDVEIFLDESVLTKPLHWRKPRTIFVCSMTDLFADFVTDEMLDRVFAVMALCPQHTFQVLSKRSARMREYALGATAEGLARRFPVSATQIRNIVAGRQWNVEAPIKWPLENVWKGVSVEDQQRADERVPDLLATPAAIRWLSCEPLLGPVDLRTPLYRGEGGITMRGYLRDKDEPDDFHYWASKLDWIVAGGESGPGARPMHPGWARSLRDQCAAAGVPFFMKQLSSGGSRAIKNIDDFPADLRIREFPRAA